MGRVGRVAQIVPATRPFAGALFAALMASKLSGKWGRREAPPGQAATKRFATAAAWFLALLHSKTMGPLLLQREIWPHGAQSIPRSGWSVEFDASPWGGGAVLREGDCCREFFFTAWTPRHFPFCVLEIGDSKHQTLWEFLALFMVLQAWGSRFTSASLHLLGDNTGSLNDALKCSGKGWLMHIAREVSWRTVRGNWAYELAHLPSEHNVVADILSRLFAPKPVRLQDVSELASATEVQEPCPEDMWCESCHPDRLRA